MFTGIIEEKGRIISLGRGSRSARLKIAAARVLTDATTGCSIAVNGVCLTVTEFGWDYFTADVMNETLSRTNLTLLKAGERVNLERAMAADGRFGGHMVSGHVDGLGEIVSRKQDGIAVRVRIRTTEKILEGMVEKGSITIDGISLTISGLFKDSFEVSLIPHTGKETTLLDKRVGDKVNLENDVVGKYIRGFGAPQSLMTTANDEIKSEGKSSGITLEFLKSCGF